MLLVVVVVVCGLWFLVFLGVRVLGFWVYLLLLLSLLLVFVVIVYCCCLLLLLVVVVC